MYEENLYQKLSKAIPLIWMVSPCHFTHWYDFKKILIPNKKNVYLLIHVCICKNFKVGQVLKYPVFNIFHHPAIGFCVTYNKNIFHWNVFRIFLMCLTGKWKRIRSMILHLEKRVKLSKLVADIKLCMNIIMVLNLDWSVSPLLQLWHTAGCPKRWNINWSPNWLL